MADSAVRVALLARPGNARDQLHRALTDLGAVLVAEGDPAELDPAAVSGQSPSLVLVSLEPAIEASLSRFDALLEKPGVEVMYDDAEVTRQLDGWDLNRWARHLAAKLLGSELLPPAPESADQVPNLDLTPRPGAVPTPAEEMADARLEDYTQDTHGMADSVPTNPSLTDVAVDMPAPMPAAPAEPEASALDIDFGELESAMQAQEEPAPAPAAPTDDFLPSGTADEPASELALDQDFEIDFDLGELDAAVGRVGTEPATTETTEEDNSTLLADIDFESNEPVRFSSFQDDEAPVSDQLDADVAAMAAQLEAFEKTDQRRPAQDMTFGAEAPAKPEPRKPEPAAAASKPAPAKPANFELSNLSLASMDEPVPASTQPAKRAEPAVRDTSHLSLESLEEPLGGAFSSKVTTQIETIEPRKSASTLSLDTLDAEPRIGGTGMVLILAGMGGPDAVRQMLSSLPESMPVPVLLYQHLEVGKHERLVEQLAKISHIPVHLAQEGGQPKPGQLSVLPAGMSARPDGASIRFGAGNLANLVAALPAHDSVVVMLSGADASLVPAARAIDEAGGLALAQDPDSCFDPAAALALKRLGGQTYPALGLARQVASRWSL